MQNESRVTVIIPNYNGLKFMDQCMEALAKQTYTDFVVLIIDNGSSDGSVSYLQMLEKEQPYPFRVRIILLKDNTGFSGAVNVGLSAAEGEYAVLLNNDTEAQPGYLEALVRTMDAGRKRRLFAVSPRMIQLYHPELLDDAGDGYNLLGWAFQRGVGQSVETPAFRKRTEIFSACAGAAIYRRDLLDKIVLDLPPEQYEDLDGNYREAAPYFDPLHFAYLEDLDVCFRAQIHGYRVLYEPAAVVHHVGSGTSGSRYNSFKVRLAARNNVYLNYKNMPLLMLLVNLPGILLGLVLKEIFFLQRGFGKDYAGGFLEGLRTLDRCRARKTGFRPERLGSYLRIEAMMIRDTIAYVRDYTTRHAPGGSAGRDGARRADGK